MEDCGVCRLNILEIATFSEDGDNWKPFLIAHGIVNTEYKCEKCYQQCTLLKWKNKYYWNCGRRVKNNDPDFKPTRCSFRRSIFTGTWFEKSKLSIDQNFIFARLFLEFHFSRTQTSEILKLSKQTVTDYTNFFRDVVTDYCFENKKQIGEGFVVEIDEAKFGRCKYHRGRVIEGQWVFGGICVQTKDCFFVTVDDRTKETLLKVIKEWIHPGTTIISDCWKSYNCLESEGFLHLTVNHSYNFVDPLSGAHTNTIERQWRDLRSAMQRMGSKVNYDGHLARIMFIKKHKIMAERVHVFWKHVGCMYS